MRTALRTAVERRPSCQSYSGPQITARERRNCPVLTRHVTAWFFS